MNDASAHDSAGLDRRQLLKAGVWAAPVLVLATAAPAAAASATGNVPVGALQVQSFPLSNENEGGLGLGPLDYAGAQIGYYNVVNGVTTAIVPWSLVLRGPDGTALLENDGVLEIPVGTFVVAAEVLYGEAPMEPGLYEVELTVIGSDTSVVTVSQATPPVQPN